MSLQAVCNVCREVNPDNLPFMVPAPIDRVGKVLLDAHMNEHKRKGELNDTPAPVRG